MIISFTIDKNTVRNAKRRNLHPVEQAIQNTTKNYDLFIAEAQGGGFDLIDSSSKVVTFFSKTVSGLVIDFNPGNISSATIPVTFKLNLPKSVVNPQAAKAAAKSSSKTKTTAKK